MVFDKNDRLYANAANRGGMRLELLDKYGELDDAWKLLHPSETIPNAAVHRHLVKRPPKKSTFGLLQLALLRCVGRGSGRRTNELPWRP